VETNLVLMRQFCYRCGALEAQKGPLIQGLCQRCFAEENRLLRAPAELEITICRRCGAYMLGKRWYQGGEEDAVMNAARATVLSAIRVARLSPAGMKLLRPREAPEVELSIEPKFKEGVIEVRAKGKIHELQAEPQVEEARIKFELKRMTCDVCSLKSAHHHEAILQVRGELTKEKRSKIRAALVRLADEESKRERKAFISDVEERKEGLDFYVNPASLARQMAALLRSEFGAKIEESAKLIGQTREGRQKFRFSILARLPSEGSY
jgi:nonsense-mediated mRNA decay protein 3